VCAQGWGDAAPDLAYPGPFCAQSTQELVVVAPPAPEGPAPLVLWLAAGIPAAVVALCCAALAAWRVRREFVAGQRVRKMLPDIPVPPEATLRPEQKPRGSLRVLQARQREADERALLAALKSANGSNGSSAPLTNGSNGAHKAAPALPAPRGPRSSAGAWRTPAPDQELPAPELPRDPPSSASADLSFGPNTGLLAQAIAASTRSGMNELQVERIDRRTKMMKSNIRARQTVGRYAAPRAPKGLLEGVEDMLGLAHAGAEAGLSAHSSRPQSLDGADAARSAGFHYPSSLTGVPDFRVDKSCDQPRGARVSAHHVTTWQLTSAPEWLPRDADAHEGGDVSEEEM